MRSALWLALSFMLVQGCAGSPVAEQLERSFDASQDATTGPDAMSAASATTTTSTGTSERQPRTSVAEDLGGTSLLPIGLMTPIGLTTRPPHERARTKQVDDSPDDPIDAGAQETQPPGSLRVLEPYRITIRLAGADPAAPAEAVTRALRKASVAFSVERIERIQPADSPRPAP